MAEIIEIPPGLAVFSLSPCGQVVADRVIIVAD